MKILTLVPAREGSKRIVRKNIRPLAGFPLIHWTLYPFRHLDPVVSSDDPEIVELAKIGGFKWIDRPPELASDNATSTVVALHALDVMGGDAVLLLQPTSPFRDPEIVEAAIQIFRDTGRPVVAMKELRHVYFDGKPAAHGFSAPTGGCYVIGADDLRKSQTFIPAGFRSIPDEGVSTLEVDTEADWEIAEAVAAQRQAVLTALISTASTPSPTRKSTA